MPTDILLDEINELIFDDGDLSIGESTEQHQKHLLLGDKGHFKNSPISGVGIGNYQNDDDLSGIYAEIQKQFKLDGMQLNTLNVFEDGRIQVDAEYADDNS